MAGKKTSVYLTQEMLDKLASSGRSLPEVIRTGLDMAPAASSPADLLETVRGVVRQTMREQLTSAVAAEAPPPGPEQRLVGAIFGEDPQTVREHPKPHVVTEFSESQDPAVTIPRATGRPKLPTLDRRIKDSMHALVTEWAAALDNEPQSAFTERVESQVRLLLESGVVPADIARGLSQWQLSDSAGVPELIPEVVEQVMEAGE